MGSVMDYVLDGAFQRCWYFEANGDVPDGYPKDISLDELRYELEIATADWWAQNRDLKRERRQREEAAVAA